MEIDQIDKLVDSIQGIRRAGKFPKFIDFIQFPKYRNLRPGTRITFDFPLTVLVGQNGTGKTSVLQAMYGAPGGKSVGNWWFGTAVDPIDAEERRVDEEEVGSEAGEEATRSQKRRSRSLEEGERSAFWYGYHEGREVREVLKTRIRRPGDPDYWEPSRPVERYGMKLLPGKTRSPTIEMEVNYLNFKTNLNAFDKCFYFYNQTALDRFSKTKFWMKEGLKKPKSSGTPGKPRPPRIQDFLRERSRWLKQALSGGNVTRIGKNEMNEVVISLSETELATVSRIIGKAYDKGLLIKHRFYESWGISVLFSTTHRQYTEAFAGSGEASVARLVHEIEMAKPGTLVLLDEPETSLHPGAQREVLGYLLRSIQEKKLQVIISTHSPVMVQHLPRSAIKVLSTDPEGAVQVSENCSPEEAFFVIGHLHDNRINVIVEDLLARELMSHFGI